MQLGNNSVKRLAIGFVPATIVVAAALRFGGLGREPLWADETLTARAASMTAGAIVSEATAWEHNPPLFSLLMHGWVRLAGYSDVAMRIPAAVFGLLTVWMVLRIARQLGSERFARASLGLAAVWPVLIVYSQEARTYSLFALLAAVSYERLLRVLDDGASRREAVLYAFAVALCLYSHNQAVFVIATHALTAFALRLRGGRRLPPARWVGAFATGIAAFLPWVPTLVRQARLVASWSDWWLPAPAPIHVLWTLYSFASHPMEYPLEPAGAPWMSRAWPLGLVTIGLSGLVAGLCVLGLVRRRDAGLRSGGALILMAWLLAPPAMAYGVSQVSTPIFLPRFQLAVVPALVLLTALGVEALRASHHRIAWILTAALLAGQGITLAQYYSTPAKEQWDEVARILSREGRSGDLVVLSTTFLRTPFSHYFHGDLSSVEVGDWNEPYETAVYLRAILPQFRRFWFVEAYSGRHGARRALEMILPRGPSATYSPRGIALSRYDLVARSPEIR